MMTSGSREKMANEKHHLSSVTARERIQLDVHGGILGI